MDVSDWTPFIMSSLSDRESKKVQSLKHILSRHLDMYENQQFFKILQCIQFHSLGQFTYDFQLPLSTYVQISSTSLTMDIQFQTNPTPTPSPLQMITNQLKENIIQG